MVEDHTGVDRQRSGGCPHTGWKRLWFLRVSLKLLDQIFSLMDTTIKHKAGDKGLPIGLPRN